jgi:hypothetical protein
MSTPKLDEYLSTSIMVRDRGACVWCGATYQSGAALSVDHLLARSWGGSDDPTNLVVACKACNDAKGNMDARAFADMIARHRSHLPALARFGTATADEIFHRTEAARLRPVDPDATRDALARIRVMRRGKD